MLMALLNDLRAARGLPLLSENALFAPDLNVFPPPKTAPASNVEIRALAKKLRSVYQAALVGVIRGKNLPAQTRKLAFVLAQLDGDALRADFAEEEIGADLVLREVEHQAKLGRAPRRGAPFRVRHRERLVAGHLEVVEAPAFAACVRILAGEGFRRFHRKGAFADAVGADQQQRIRHAPRRQHPPQNVFDMSVADEPVEHKKILPRITRITRIGEIFIYSCNSCYSWLIYFKNSLTISITRC